MHLIYLYLTAFQALSGSLENVQPKKSVHMGWPKNQEKHSGEVTNDNSTFQQRGELVGCSVSVPR